MTDDTICAISTPPGTGGIAVARISGPQALDITRKIWRGKHDITTSAPNTVHVGTVLDTHGQELDKAVATVFRSPHSFTGEDTVELSVHGSRWIQQELIMSLIQAGARMADAGEFTRRAFLNARIDLVQAEAVADIIASESRAAQRMALSQMKGTFSSRIAEMREQLLELAALLELELDFSEEDVQFASRDKLMELAAGVRDTTRRLAQGFAAGQAIRNGIPVAIVGATNAGKSSILNALAEDERAIVSDIHGTTRDIVEDVINIGDYTLRLMDTAGIRETTDTIENLGIQRSRNALHSAAIILLVIDNTADIDAAPWDEIKGALSNAPGTPLIVVANKSDIAPQPSAIPVDEAIIVKTSALTGYGIPQLRHTIEATIKQLCGHIGNGTDPIISNARHYTALTDAAAAADRTIASLRDGLPGDLVATDLRDCIAALGIITGAISTPEILSTIFSRFCIGK